MKKKTWVIDIFIILLLGFLSITWFRGDKLISGGDFGLPLDWVRFLKSVFLAWEETISLGIKKGISNFLFVHLFGAILQSLGFSLVTIEKVLFYIWFTGGGLSMYYLCSVLRMKRVGKLAASFFYMLNPFSLMIIWRVSHGWIQMPYAFTPFILGVYLNGIRREKYFRYIVLANLSSVFLSGGIYGYSRIVFCHAILIFFYFLSVVLFEKKKRVHALKFSFLFFGLLALFNFYWLFPHLHVLKEGFVGSHPSVLIPDIEGVRLTSVSLPEAVRMLGYWSTKSGYKGDPYYPYWQYYNSPFINLISWLIPVLGVLGIWGLFKDKTKDKTLRYFLLLVVIFGLIGISGAHPPFGKLLVWFYERIPYATLAARFSFLLYGLPTYLIFSLLLGYGFLTLYDYGKKRFGQLIWGILGVLGILVGVVLVWPFWNGEVIQSKGKIFPSERFQVPGYWWETKKWLARQEDFFRILPLPMSKTYNVAFDWGEGYSGTDITCWLSPKPWLYANTGESFKVPELIGNLIENESDLKGVAKLLGYLNVRYLLFREDTRWEFLRGHGWWFYHQPENIQNFIKNQDNLRLEKEIGQLKFYRVADDYLLPRIYVARTVSYINGEVASLEDLAQFLEPEEREAFILGKEGDYIWRRPVVPEKEGKSDFTRAVYEVQVNGEGEYEMLLRDDGFLQFYQGDKGKLRIRVDQGEIGEKSFKPAGSNLISLGEVKLKEGDHIITVFSPSAVNLVDDSSRDQGFKIIAIQDKQTVSFPVKDFKPGETYGISLRVKNVAGSRPHLLIWENYTDEAKPIFDQPLGPFDAGLEKTTFSRLELPVGSSWQNFDFTFKPNSYAESIGISLVSLPNLVGDFVFGKTENWFRDLKVQRVFTNPMVLRWVDGDDRVVVNPPKISFRQRNPVKYEVEIKGAEKPFWLVFSEAFHPGWKASIGGEHEALNGFANGWYFEKTGDYKFDIYFAPQKILWFSMAVSGLTTLLCLVYLGYKFLAPRRGRELKFARTILL